MQQAVLFKMRRLIFILMVPGNLFAQSGFAQVPERNVVARDSFPPEIQSVRITGYLLSWTEQGDTILSESQSTYLELDKTGHWAFRADQFTDGDVSRDSTWYDAKLRTRFLRRVNSFEPSTTTTVYNPDGTVNSIFFDAEQRDDVAQSFAYNKNGQLIRRTETFMDQQSVDEYTYDKSGKLIRKTSAAGSVTEKKPVVNNEQLYMYNAAGQCVQMIELFYGAKDVVRLRDTVWYTYDESGRLSTQRESRQNGNSRMFTSYTYDGQGRLVEKRYSFINGTTVDSETTTSFVYDEQGFFSRLSEESTRYGFTRTWSTTYNAAGLPVESVYSTESEVILYKWTYTYR